MWQRWVLVLCMTLAGLGAGGNVLAGAAAGEAASGGEVVPASDAHAASDSWALVFVLLLATFVGLGVIMRVSRLLHTPLMSLTNAISAIAVVGAILVAGPDYPWGIRLLGAVAVFAAMTNIVSGFLITDRMLRMFKQTRQEPKP
ncbi:MAG: NAD(P) transhydrogenase subunit alpha [Thermoguttaceae bacterium]|jgi:NAD(P) transhydrogenase subunit alpha|nr:NAD(P) transhydrogenase subunit alpha [Thermoguttaceae bacterium]